MFCVLRQVVIKFKNMVTAKITEIFSSIQGEGMYIGERMLFVRFYGCNMHCRWCDEAYKSAYEELTIVKLFEQIKSLLDMPVSFISLTGGEPLIHSDYIKELLPVLRDEGFRVYLETNGTLPEQLEKVIDGINVISMDIKIPSSTGDLAYWEKHLEFLSIAKNKDVSVKVVVSNQVSIEEFETAIKIVESVDRRIPFVLQPVTVSGRAQIECSADFLLMLRDKAESILCNVAVIPQTHKLLGVR